MRRKPGGMCGLMIRSETCGSHLVLFVYRSGADGTPSVPATLTAHAYSPAALFLDLADQVLDLFRPAILLT